MFDSKEFEWSDLSVLIGGVLITGITSVKYNWKKDKSFRYGKGSEPQSIQSGNKSYEGEVILTQQEYKKLSNASGKQVDKLQFDITCSYGDPTKGIPRTTDQLVGCEFSEAGKEFKSGDGNMNISLPFMFLKLREDI